MLSTTIGTSSDGGLAGRGFIGLSTLWRNREIDSPRDIRIDILYDGRHNPINPT